MENLIIVGIGTNARHAFEFVKMYNLYNIIGFAVSSRFYSENEFLGLPVYKLENLKETLKIKFRVFVALLWNKLNKDRKNLFEYCEKAGLEFANLISPHSIIRSSSSIGRNCWIHDFAIIQNNSIIGDNVPIMAYSLIGADCKVGSHCFFGAKSVLGGGSTIGEQSFIGINATVFDDTIIGIKCIIGACSIVKRNMADFTKIISSSDLIIKQYSEEVIEDKLLYNKNLR